MLNIKGFISGTMMLLGSTMINYANADGPYSCWTNGNTIRDGSRCFGRTLVQTTALTQFFWPVWGPEYCRSWCDDVRSKKGLNVYNFPYYDGKSWNSCDGDAIYKGKVTVHDGGNLVRKEEVDVYLKSHPINPNATPRTLSLRSSKG